MAFHFLQFMQLADGRVGVAHLAPVLLRLPPPAWRLGIYRPSACSLPVIAGPPTSYGTREQTEGFLYGGHMTGSTKYQSLLDVFIDDVEGTSIDPQADQSISSGNVSVFFRNQEKILADKIRASEMVLGAVAWLTSPVILDALTKPECAIVVQKEDFLRPDGTTDSWPAQLQARYAKLRCYLDRFSLPGIAPELSYCGSQDVDPVRCVGNYNLNKSPAMPRMHNKFLVFCEIGQEETRYGMHSKVKPLSVWTGSMNLSYNATKSLENAVLINDARIAEAYAKEWAQIFAMSEPLNWESVWVSPEWRIGS